MTTPFNMRNTLLLLVAVSLGCVSTFADKAPIQSGPLQISSGEWRVADYVFVITDASGTMYVNETFPEAKSLTRSFVAAMPAADAPAQNPDRYQAASIGFSGNQRISTPLQSFDRGALANRSAELTIIGDVSGTGGTTPFHRVFGEVAEALEGKSGRAALVIFSDGIPDDEGRAIAAAEKLASGHSGDVCFHGVQTGTDPEGQAFLRSLAALTGCGSLRSAADITTGAEVQQLARSVFAGPAPPPVAAGPCAGVIRLRGIEFAFDKYEVTDDSTPVLDVAVERLNQCPEIRVTIGGHTDSIGTEEYNLGLSTRRAMATQSYFVRSGIDPSRLDTEGYGMSQPIAPNDTRDGRMQNRRVELGASQ